MTLSISRRIFLAFSCVILLLGAQGLATALHLRSLMAESQRLGQATDDAQRLADLLNRTHTEVAILVGSRNPVLMDSYRDRFRADWARLEQLAAPPGPGPAGLAPLKEAYDQAIQLQYQFAFEMAQQQLAAAVPRYEAAAALVARGLDAAERNKARALRQASVHALAETVALGLLAVATALFWAWYLQRFFTDRKRAEAALAAALHRLESVLNSATQVAIILTDPQGLVQLFNRGAELMTGWKAVEVVNRRTPELWHDPDELRQRRQELAGQGHQLDALFDVFSARPRVQQAERRTWTLITREGERRRIDLVITRVDDLQGALMGFLGIATDVTQQEATAASLHQQEEKLRHSQKLEAVGQLAGGVAHDFNNMLAGILGSAELLAGAFPEEDPRAKLVRVIANASQRAADLTGKLLSFSRKGKLISTPFSLHRTLQETLALLQRSIDRSIELRQELGPGDPMVVGDPSQIENALLNLCINARDAMPDGGVLTVRSEIVDRAGSPFVNVFVTDTGTGIPWEIRQRIFEPFFTTKPQGKGTGLGLAAAYGIVQAHHGTLEVESEPGRGTTFLIQLPLDSRAAPPVPAEPGPRRGSGVVLVVDDEEVVRTTTAMLLGSAGYDVVLAAGGEEALRLYQQQPERISVVLLDLIMPGISGKDTFQRLRALAPSVCVVFTSGFASERSVPDLLANGVCGFLHKPFTRNELLEAVERALAGHAAADPAPPAQTVAMLPPGT